MFGKIKKLFGGNKPSNPFRIDSFDTERGVLKAGEHEVSFTNKTHDSWPHGVTPITEELSQTLAALRRQSVGLIEKYNPKYDGSDLALPIALDITFAKWLASPSETREDSQYVIDSLGAIYGEALVQLLGCQWTLFEDESGKSVAVYHPRTNNFVFPFDAIAKRVDKNEIDFFHNIFLVTKASIENAKA